MKIHIRNPIVHSKSLNFLPSQIARLDAIVAAHFKYLWKSLNRSFLAPAFPFSHTGWAPSCVTCVLGYDIYDCMHWLRHSSGNPNATSLHYIAQRPAGWTTVTRPPRTSQGSPRWCPRAHWFSIPCSRCVVLRCLPQTESKRARKQCFVQSRESRG